MFGLESTVKVSIMREISQIIHKAFDDMPGFVGKMKHYLEVI